MTRLTLAISQSVHAALTHLHCGRLILQLSTETEWQCVWYVLSRHCFSCSRDSTYQTHCHCLTFPTITANENTFSEPTRVQRQKTANSYLHVLLFQNSSLIYAAFTCLYQRPYHAPLKYIIIIIIMHIYIYGSFSWKLDQTGCHFPDEIKIKLKHETF